MSHSYQSLIERIRGEVQDLELVVERAQHSWTLVQHDPPEPEVYIDSVALNLHSFYSGLERLFELIARHVDHHLPERETWHRDLLLQMAQDIPGLRPAVISQENGLNLDEFRRFRHLVRNVYTINLMPEKMSRLITALPELWFKLQAELLAFADYLDVLTASF
ncbi:MAG: antitoxin [Anaerolineales bacterium]|nr:antitoxin [Anaerolineales bacterium]